MMAVSLSTRKSAQQLVVSRTDEIRRKRAAARLRAAESLKLKTVMEKAKAAEAEARIAAARDAIISEAVHPTGVKDFTAIKAKRDALRNSEMQSVEGSFLAKLFVDDAAQFLFEAREQIRACEFKLLELSGGAPDLDETFPVPVLEMMFCGSPIVDENFKEVGRQTIIEWCYGAYLYSPHYSRPLLISQSVHDGILEKFKSIYERFEQLSPTQPENRAPLEDDPQILAEVLGALQISAEVLRIAGRVFAP
jgi:hypothetical protein